MDTSDFTLGIEEEYLLVDLDTLALAVAPENLLSACQRTLGDKVSPEYMQCQIEVGTGVCADIGEARADLQNLRRCVAQEAAKFNLAPISASCHPFGDWKTQDHRDRKRYNQLQSDLGGVARRMLICGMHVHVGIGTNEARADLLGQLSYFLPHLLALSTSSPFWQGEDTGLASYRISVFDNLPRTGLPPDLNSWDSFERSVETLIKIGVIEDSSKIWWDLRPSSRFPTLETRICDAQPRLEHALSLAALNQCLNRMLTRLRTDNQRWRRFDNFLVGENRWRAQRYGITGGLVDFGRAEIVPMTLLVEELIAMLEQDAIALDCQAELLGLRAILEGGTSADRQRAAAAEAAKNGADAHDQMKAVVVHLLEEFHRDL